MNHAMNRDARPDNMGLRQNAQRAAGRAARGRPGNASGNSYQPTTEHFFLQRDWSAGLVRTVNGYNLSKCYRMITLYPFRFLVVGQIFGEISLGQNCSAAE